MKTGLYLGRFNPLHAGHLAVMERILNENDRLIVCIGSSQKAEPFTGAERCHIIRRQLGLLFPGRDYRIYNFTDPEPIDSWPEDIKILCEINESDINTFYRADLLPKKFVKILRNLKFRIKIVKRENFLYHAPNGLYYRVNSSTDIKRIHRNLNINLK